MTKLSQHPSATPELPQLGITLPKDQAKPDRPEPDSPWYRKLWHDIESWHVDTRQDPRIQEAVYDYQLDKERRDADEKAAKIRQLMPKPVDSEQELKQ